MAAPKSKTAEVPAPAVSETTPVNHTAPDARPNDEEGIMPESVSTVTTQNAGGHKPPPNGSESPAAEIPSPNAGDELDEFARFEVKDVNATATGEPLTCKVGPPNKMMFIRAPLDTSLYKTMTLFVHETGTKKQTYLIDPKLQDHEIFEGYTKTALLAPYITHHGALGIWPISVTHEDNPVGHGGAPGRRGGEATVGGRRPSDQAELVQPSALPEGSW
jgi:hypothetical protein